MARSRPMNRPTRSRRRGPAPLPSGRRRLRAGNVRLRLPAIRAWTLPLTRMPGISRRSRSSSPIRRPAIRSASAAISAARQAAGLAQADDQRRRQRAGAQPPLLPAAGKQRQQADTRAAADEQRADPLGTIELVAADRGQIDFPAGQVERDFADRLRQIGVEQRPGLPSRSPHVAKYPGSRRSRCSPPSR